MQGVIAFVVVAFAVVAAQDASSQPATVDVGTIVQMQQYTSAQLLDVILKFQQAQYSSMGASYFLMENQKKNGGVQSAQHPYGYAFLEESEDSDVRLEEEDDDDEEEEEEAGSSASALRLQAAYYLLHANQIRLYQILLKSPQIQSEYYLNRYLQLTVAQASAAGQLPPQITQLLYLQSFNTQLKTLRLSYNLQYVSHFRTWLEDEVDVNAALASEAAEAETLAEAQLEDILVDKQFAFGSFYQFAMMDFQTFWLDFYVQQMFAALSAQSQQPAAAAAATSLLEEESVSGEQAQFLSPLFALFALTGAAGPTDTWSFYYKYYALMMQMSAAQAGYNHYNLENQIANGEDDSNVDYDQLQKSSDTSFAWWASSSLQVAQINYILAIFGMYSVYAPSMGAAANNAAAK